jgi:hypothetical protein
MYALFSYVMRVSMHVCIMHILYAFMYIAYTFLRKKGLMHFKILEPD